ncbi:MAG: acylphosphatase [bacterium]
MEIGAHIIVKGLVQGVGYRYFVYRYAISYKLLGFVRNLYDGNVEIQVEGERGMIEEFIQRLKVGPRSAHVTDMKIEWRNVEKTFKEFDIK